ncbi:GntR family transcriptional regulator [Bacillus coreaensis]
MNNELFNNNALSNLIKETIMRDILLGSLIPGEKLVEAQYAEAFGTSRAPVREAFYLLTLEGIVKRIPRKGTVVRGFSSEETKDLIEIRCFLENMALEKLRNKNNENYLQTMEDIIIKTKDKQSYEYAELNYQFHQQLIVASESEVIKLNYERLGNILLSIQNVAFMKEEDVRKSISEHEQLVKYLYEKNIDDAKKLLDSHNRSVFDRVERNVQGYKEHIES